MTTTQNTSELFVAGGGSLWVAPAEGAVLPTTITDAVDNLDDAFVNLGLLSQDGGQLVMNRTVTPHYCWPLDDPARYIVENRQGALQGTLRQFNGETVVFAQGGGEVVEVSPGEFRIDPPELENIDERALVYILVDGDRRFGFVIRRGMITETGNIPFNRTALSELPFTFSAMGVAGAKPWYQLSDDADAFGAGS